MVSFQPEMDENSKPERELALVVSGGSGSMLAVSLATAALQSEQVRTLHLIVTGSACKVLGHELGAEWSSARGLRDNLPVKEALRSRVAAYSDNDMAAAIASGSHRLHGVVVLPCSAGMAGSLANGISRGLGQRVADVALKQRWPLVVGIRETPMSLILLENLARLARAGAHIVPPLPAFYLLPDEASALRVFIDHYCLRVFDLLGLNADNDSLRWQG